MNTCRCFWLTRQFALDLLSECWILFEVIIVVWQRVEYFASCHDFGKWTNNAGNFRIVTLSKRCSPESRSGQARRSEPPHSAPSLLDASFSRRHRPKVIPSSSSSSSPAPHRHCLASTSPFTEPTSPNPAVTKYAEAAEALHTYGSYLTQCLPKYVQQFSVLRDELTLYTAPSGILPILTFLRDHSQCQFKAAMDISGADYPEREKRFEVVYHLLSVKNASRIRVKTYAGEGDHVPSAVEIFRGADW